MRLSPFLFGTAALILASQPVSAQDYSADTVVATVNGTQITLGHMEALRQNLSENYRRVPASTIYEAILNQLIDEQVLASAAERAGLDRRSRTRLFMENDRRSTLANEAITALQRTDIPMADFNAAYAAMVAEMEGQFEYNASHILVETEAEALDLISQLNNGADFATLARAHSTGPTGPNGGLLGWFAAGDMVPQFDAAVQAMEPETIFGPVQTQFGWHVIRLNERVAVQPPTLADVREDLEYSLRTQRLTSYIDTLRGAAQIEMSGVPGSALNGIDLGQ